VKIVRGTLNASASGHVAVTLSCPSSARGACAGTLVLTTKIKAKAAGKKRSKTKKPKTTTVTLAHATFTIAPGSSKSVQLHLSSTARSLLRAAGRGGLAVTLTATAKDASGVSVRTSLAESLKARHAARPHRHRH
jgi:hypothetical protein